MNDSLRTKFESLAKNGMVTSVGVVAILKKYGLAFSRRTLRKWVILGLVDPPEELNGVLGKGRRTGYSRDAVVKIMATKFTIDAISGLGKGGRLKRRLAALKLAIGHAQARGVDIAAIAGDIDLVAMGLANKAIRSNLLGLRPERYVKLIRVAALVFAMYHNLLSKDDGYNATDCVRILNAKGILSLPCVKLSRLSIAPFTKDTANAVNEAMEKTVLVRATAAESELKAWSTLIFYFDSDGWLADKASAALSSFVSDCFGRDAKASWMVAALLVI